MRRYVDAWRKVLPPNDSQPEVEKALLRFDNGRLMAIDQALDATYAATLADLNRDLDTQRMMPTPMCWRRWRLPSRRWI